MLEATQIIGMQDDGHREGEGERERDIYMYIGIYIYIHIIYIGIYIYVYIHIDILMLFTYPRNYASIGGHHAFMPRPQLKRLACSCEVLKPKP